MNRSCSKVSDVPLKVGRIYKMGEWIIGHGNIIRAYIRQSTPLDKGVSFHHHRWDLTGVVDYMAQSENVLMIHHLNSDLVLRKDQMINNDTGEETKCPQHRTIVVYIDTGVVER